MKRDETIKQLKELEILTKWTALWDVTPRESIG